MKRIAAFLLVAVFPTGLLTACGASEAPATPPPDPPAGVSVSLAQWRSDEPVHAIEVAVRNATDTPVYFADVQLVTPSFQTLPPKRADALLKRTPRTDLQIPYGAAKCSPKGLPALQPATVVAHLRTGSDPLRRVVFKVPHPDPLLTRLLRDECSAFLIKEAADIEFGADWTQVGKVMRGSLVLTRHGTGVVAVQDVGGTTHYIATPVKKSKPLATLDAGAQRAEVALQLTPGRCDPHAFAEGKKAFLFPVRATIDGGDERVVIVVPPKPLQERLTAYALKTCGLGG
ncbi:hypothetical protein ACGFNP_08640 [Nonomuraea sp. NPDC049269]|uniref:hypothetical protein n=1 Tax=Nonomuraea sp. NPDC049269 TaxID=3364349 RepID=UPI003719CEEC